MTADRRVDPDFKICGTMSPEDAESAAEVGARYVGAILVPESPRAVSAERAADIGRAVDIPLAIVVAASGAEQTIRDAETAGAGVIQLQGGEDLALIEALRAAGPWEIWKAVQPRSVDELLDAAFRFQGAVDLLLVDAWHPERLGGTGSRADWSGISGVRERIPSSLRLGLAGGLDPANVADAVRLVQPDLVDVSSGVEASPGRKDPGLVRAFAREVRAASASMAESERNE